MDRIKLGVIGAGNIVASRHLPALDRQRNLFDVVGIMDSSGNRSQSLAAKYGIPKWAGYAKYALLSDIDWFDEVEAVLIGTPPAEHYPMCKMALLAGKHVLVEKPFVVNIAQGHELIELARQRGLHLAVNHNFQFSSAFSRLHDYLQHERLGDIISFSSTQISNGDRRLPKWAECLPSGLFYDESPHVLYLFQLFAKDAPVATWAHCTPGVKPQTPGTVTFEIQTARHRCHVYINFESPICEWTFSIYGSEAIAVVDLFRDILVILPNDGRHLMKEVLRTSLLATAQHWFGFITNGTKYIRNKLDYGFCTVHQKFFTAIKSGDSSNLSGITARDGLYINELQHQIIDLCSDGAVPGTIAGRTNAIC